MTEKVNVPKLRFGEFEGEWNEVDISSLGKVVTGSTPPTSDPSNYLGDRLFISPADLDGRKYISSTKTTLSQKGFDTGRLLPSGSVCFVCIGSTIGKVAINSEDAISNQQINAVVVNHKKYDSDFVYSRLIKDSPRIKLLAGEQAVPILNKSSFGKVKVFTPPLHEQQKIASFLSKVDEKIALLTEKKDKLTEYKKGVMQQLFNGRWEEQDGQLTFVPPTLRFKADDDSEFPDWEEKKLGGVGSIVSGLTYSPENVVEHGTLVLRSSNIQNDQLSFQDNVYVNADKFNPVMEGDILICVRNGSKNLIGKSALITAQAEGMAFGAFMTVYRSKYSPYLQHYFKTDTYKRNVHRNLGATINSINGSDLKRFKISMPSQAEQNKIATLLNSLDMKIHHTISELEKAKEWKRGLLQQMFV